MGFGLLVHQKNYYLAVKANRNKLTMIHPLPLKYFNKNLQCQPISYNLHDFTLNISLYVLLCSTSSCHYTYVVNTQATAHHHQALSQMKCWCPVFYQTLFCLGSFL